MSYIMVDIESDGPCPPLYSMVSFGAVVVREGLKDTFYSEILIPISDEWMPEALAISGVARQDMVDIGKHPKTAMEEFERWLQSVSKDKPMFISDNNGFDWQFINYYFWAWIHRNPFGHSSTNLGSLYKGMEKSMFKNFKHLRKTKHTHNPVDDAKGNAEALLHMKDKMNLGIKLE